MISFPAIPMAMPSRASKREVSLRPRALRAVAAEIRARARAAREPAPGAELIAVSPLAFRVRWQSPPVPDFMDSPDAPRVLRLHVTDARGKHLSAFDTYLPLDHGLRTVTIRHDRAWVRAEIGWLNTDGTLLASVSSARVAAIPLEPSTTRHHRTIDIRRPAGSRSLRPRAIPPPAAIPVSAPVGFGHGPGRSGEGPGAQAGDADPQSARTGWPQTRLRDARRAGP